MVSTFRMFFECSHVYSVSIDLSRMINLGRRTNTYALTESSNENIINKCKEDPRSY